MRESLNMIFGCFEVNFAHFVSVTLARWACLYPGL